MKKRLVSLALTLCMLMSLVVCLPTTAGAVTQQDAVNWLNAQNGAYYNLDGAYGAQCSDFVSAYMNWLYSGETNPYQGYGVYNANYYPTVAGWNTSRWEVIKNYPAFVPQPGDIFVSKGADSRYGHVGVVISSDVNNATVIDQNYVNWNYTTGSAAVIHNVNWSGAYAATYYIRYKEFSAPQSYVEPQYAVFDVNGVLDAVEKENVSGFGTFDVYLNGERIANDVSDFYKTDCTPGTSYEIKDIKMMSGKAYGGISGANRCGSVNGTTAVSLIFNSIPDDVGVATVTKMWNGHKYIYVPRPSSWYAAKALSEKLGGHLVTVNSAEEENFLRTLTDYCQLWIGATDSESEGNWRWVTGEPFSYSNWNVNQPDNFPGSAEGNENYLHFGNSKGANWNDNEGYVLYHFVCEIDNPVCTHSWGKWSTVTAAICTAPGTETRTCTLCGETETRTVNAPGHSYSNGTCTRCGAADPNYTAPVVPPATKAEPSVTPTVTKEVHFPKQTVYFQDQFADVPSDQWFTPTVAAAFELGLMKGNSATSFKPYGDVTIAEAVTMAARIHSIYTTGSESFVQTDKWYQCYLDYAYQNGIISYAYYNCDANHKATRAQFAEIFAAALPDEALPAINAVADNAVPDVKSSATYAPSVYKLYRAGILTGGDVKGTFSPLTYITRAECATIVARMADSDNRVEFTFN